MLKMKLQYFGKEVTHRKRPCCLERLKAGGEWGGQRIRWLDGITDSGHGFEQALGVGDGQGGLACCSTWGHEESDITE